MESHLITPLRFAEALMTTITGYPYRKPEIININDTREHGDITFCVDLEDWEDYIDTNVSWYSRVNNILEYYKYRALMHPRSKEWNNTMILIVLKQSTLGEYNRIHNCNIDTININLDLSYSGNYVRVLFYPSIITHYAVRTVLEAGPAYGQKLINNKQFRFLVNFDQQSEISNLRLHLLRKVTENMLQQEGYSITYDEYCSNTFIFTTNATTLAPGNAKLIVCGSASEFMNSTQSFMTKDQYVMMVTELIRILWEQHYPNLYINIIYRESDLVKTAFAAIYYELLSIRFNNPVAIRINSEMDHIKEAGFCLYINVKIAMTIDIYWKFISSILPELIPITGIPLFHCANNPATWYMVYNYIIRFPDMMDFAVSAQTKLEVNIQSLWTFTINLCRDFNKYFVQEKILSPDNQVTVGIDEALEKWYIFTALRMVLKKAFVLLELQEVLYLC